MADSTPRGYSVRSVVRDEDSGELVLTGEDGSVRPRVRSLDAAVVGSVAARSAALVIALG